MLAPVAYSRGGGQPGSAKGEYVRIEPDSTVHIWRSASGPLVGSFARTLETGEASMLEKLALAATAHEPAVPDMLPEAGLVAVAVGDRSIRFGDGSAPLGPWSELVRYLESLRTNELGLPAAPPVAAIELVVDDGRSARLVHRGMEEVAIDLTELTVEAVSWSGYYLSHEKWSAAPQVASETRAAPGWSLALPFDHGLETGPGRTLHAAARFTIVRTDGPVAVEPAVRPAIPYPGATPAA